MTATPARAPDDNGWYWVSDEPFGWVAYHYGRWTRLRNVGWVWVPFCRRRSARRAALQQALGENDKAAAA